MSGFIEAHQLSNGEWKLTVKTDLVYYQHLDFKKEVKDVMEENGLHIFRLVGAE